MLAGGALSSGASAGGGANITFSGRAFAHQDVADFMTRLGLMPQLINIQLVSAQKSAASGSSSGTAAQELVTFQITAQLRPFEIAPPLAAAAPAGGQ
jgi:hypothetical protein